MSDWVVVLAGGVGSRFWPLSTPTRPKQLLPLVTERPLLREAVERMRPIADGRHTLILTNASLVEPIAELLTDIPRDNIIAEPRPSGTAAALAWAARTIVSRESADAVMLSIHADWAVGDPEGFRRALRQAGHVAAHHGMLVTVGVVPTRPDPGFGYIQPGVTIAPGVNRVKRFAEKPERTRAEQMCADGYLWNSGIFAWRVADFLDEIHAHTPEIAEALARHGADRVAFFSAARSISVDVGVLERSARVAVIRGDFGWDDVGTWGSLLRVRQADDAGNAVFGDVIARQAADNVVHSEGVRVVLYGVSNLVVVARDGLVLVTTVDRSSDLKGLIEALPASVRDDPSGGSDSGRPEDGT